MDSINKSPAAWGVASFVATLGSRYVIESLTPAQQKVLAHPLIKRVIIVCMVFIVTRDVMKSIIVTAGVVLILELLANEKSRFCMLPKPLLVLQHVGLDAAQ